MRVVFFVADDGQHGRELWISDGTTDGTSLVRDIRPGPESSAISQLTPAGNRVFFTAVNQDGRELWVSDGTRGSTKRVKDIFRGPLGSDPSLLTPMGSDILFVADDGRRGRSVWISDGTRSGTKRLLSRKLDRRLNKIEDLLARGRFVYIVDRSEIVIVKRNSRQLTRVARPDHRLFSFIGTSLSEVSRSVLVRDKPNLFDVGSLSFIDRRFRHREIVDVRTGEPVATYFNRDGLPVRNRFFFGRGVVLSGIPSEARVPDGLWVWDPKVGGAYRVAFPNREIPHMVPLGRNLVFTMGEVERTLWYSDGTEAGTHQLFADNVRSLASAGPYAGVMPNAVELWITDGTAAGTQLVADFSTVAINRGFPPLVGDRGRLWFVVDYIGFGRELWTSDGTFAGTRSPGDIRPGPEGSDPDQITPAWIVAPTA